MRVYKFRAWDSYNNQMLDVQELNFEDCFNGGEMQIRTTMYGDYFDYREMPIMQYTGMKDINGIEIYEGDIVAEKGHYVNSDRLLYQKIQWKDNYACWLRGECQRLTPKNIERYKIVVIGNIYDNPELLKEEV